MYIKQTVQQVKDDLKKNQIWNGKVAYKYKKNRYRRLRLDLVAVKNGFFNIYNDEGYEFYKLLLP